MIIFASLAALVVILVSLGGIHHLLRGDDRVKKELEEARAVRKALAIQKENEPDEERFARPA